MGQFKEGMTLAYFYYTAEDGEHHTATLTLGIDGSGTQMGVINFRFMVP